MTEKDIQERKKGYFLAAMIYAVIGIALLGYCIFVFTTTHPAAGIMALSVGCLALVLALRNHFWFIQIKNRKLGCTYQDWFNFTFHSKNKVAE